MQCGIKSKNKQNQLALLLHNFSPFFVSLWEIGSEVSCHSFLLKLENGKSSEVNVSEKNPVLCAPIYIVNNKYSRTISP